MKKTVLMSVLSILLFLLPAPGKRPTAPAPDSSGSGNVWVYMGHWRYSSRGADMSGDLSELRRDFEDCADTSPLDADNPLTGVLGDIFILDGTALYLEDASMGAIFGCCDVNIMSGTLRAEAVYTAGNAFIGPECDVTANGEIDVGGAFVCRGGSIAAGTIMAKSVWFDSSESALDVTVSDSIYAGYYTQAGGEVIVSGGIYCLSPDDDENSVCVSISGDYSAFGAPSLRVGGDIVAVGDSGNIEIGQNPAGFDEVGRFAFEAARLNKKAAIPAASAYCGGINVNASDIKASRAVTVYSGETVARGAIETLDNTAVISVFGGTVNACEILSGALRVGTDGDYYGTNSEIKIIADQIDVLDACVIAGTVIADGVPYVFEAAVTESVLSSQHIDDLTYAVRHGLHTG